MLYDNVEKQAVTSPMLKRISSRRVDLKEINGQLVVEYDGMIFHVDAYGDYAVIYCDNLLTLLLNLRKVKHEFHRTGERVDQLNGLLCAMGITLCLQYRHIGILGAKVSAFISKLFIFAAS